MKATNNNTDTLFMDIFVELFAIAKVYFQELFKNADPGTYTIKDIYAFIEKNIEATKEGKLTGVNSYFKDQYAKTLEKSPYYTKVDSFEKYTITYLCRVTDNIVSIEKGNFKCSFDVVKVFEYLERFKKLLGAKEKLEFVKEGNQIQESEDNCICSFDIAFDKKDKTFLAAKTKNSSRYIDNNVLIDINLSKIYVTDRFICKSRNVKISNLSGVWGKHICISFDIFKKLVGKDCHIIVNSDDKEGQIIVTVVTDKDEMFECRYNDFNKNVNIEGVCPILYKELKLTVKDGKQFAKDLKTISKISEFVSFEVEKGSARLKVNYITEFGASNEENKYGEFYVQLSEPSNFTYRSDNRSNRVLSCLDGWNGEIYFTKEYDYCKLSFVSDNCDNCFMIDCNKQKWFDPIRDKADCFPDKLTPVSCKEETKESETYEPQEGDIIEFTTTSYQVKPIQAIVQYNDGLGHFVSINEFEIPVKRLLNIKPIGTPESKDDASLQESKESVANVTETSEKEKEFELSEVDKEFFVRCNYSSFYKKKEFEPIKYKNSLIFDCIDYVSVKSDLKKGDQFLVSFIDSKGYGKKYVTFDGNSLLESIKSDLQESIRYLQETYKEGIKSFCEYKVLSYLGICRLESKNGNKVEFLNVFHAYNTFRCSLGGIIEYLNNKGFDVILDKDNNVFVNPKDNDSLIHEIHVYTYTKRLEIISKVGVSIQKDMNINISFAELLEQSLTDLKRHATNKVFFFMEKEGYSWQQPNAQTFHLFKNGKEKTFKNEFEAYNFVQNKENKRYFDFNVSDYADGMLELVGLDLENLIFKVNQNSPKELKVIQDIKLYDKTGKIVFTYNDGSVDTVIETTFNGYSVLQSVLQSINENV